MRLRMGTRGSALALAQSGQAAVALKTLVPGLEVETVVIKTSGDLFSVQSPSAAKDLAGTKGLFVKEIEEALLKGSIDFAVHSAKDLPAELAPGLVIGAYPRREDARDAFIGRGGLTWASLGEGHAVATSSLRRKVQLEAVKPGVAVLPIRGNVDTRLRKLSDNLFDGIIIALAGLLRLGRADVAHEILTDDVMLPAPGQGALALEVRQGDAKVQDLVGKLDHPATRLAVELERAFLGAFGGGCSVPLGALARPEGTGARLTVFWGGDGQHRRLSELCSDLARGAEFARDLASRLRAAR